VTATPPGRPPGDGAPREGTPEFEWLYGARQRDQKDDPSAGKHRAGEDATRPVPRQPRPDERPESAQEPQRPPEETQVMEILPPSQSRSSLSGRERRAALKAQQDRETAERPSRPTPPPLAPPPGRGSSGRGPRFRFRYVFLLLLLWLVFLVLVPLVAWNKVSKIDAMPDGKRPGDQPGTTYLLVGSDSRAGLTAEERKDLSTGGAAGQRADTIMLLHTGSGPNLLMSIPRDSLVPIPGEGTNKINAATALGGPKLMVRTVELNTGIRIDSYVEIGFGGFVGLVDAVDGIEICPDEDMVDADAGLRIKKGCQDVDGKVALAYARSRKTQQLGDIDRARHQREVVAAVGEKALSPWSVINPLRYWNLNMAGAEFIAVDDESGPVTAAKLFLGMTQVDDGLTCGVPIADLAVHWDTERSQRLFKLIQQDKTDAIRGDLCTPSGIAR
jgi:LCP family protein required for cell wall assembly